PRPPFAALKHGFFYKKCHKTQKNDGSVHFIILLSSLTVFNYFPPSALNFSRKIAPKTMFFDIFSVPKLIDFKTRTQLFSKLYVIFSIKVFTFVKVFDIRIDLHHGF
ncbi:MAG: hypothetical protein PUE10_07080, partial [Bacteroidales bacterium]|nr:hypothetical protein [Bacteroidales bacterium]